jgi:S-adenosylmethionine:tRNA ribosyltransferase-isomerase
VISEEHFSSLPKHIPQGALMVFNNTRVIQARLRFRKETGAQIEVFCLEPESPADYQQIFQETEQCVWQCLVGNSNRWKSGILSQVINVGGKDITLSVERMSEAASVNKVRFFWDGNVTFAELLDAAGELPIPPYLNRKTQESDKTTYQTVYSKVKGSVAAPTAGLHFSKHLLKRMEIKGIESAFITLHVGLGNFRTVDVEDLSKHKMDSEQFFVTPEAVEQMNNTKRAGHKIVAIGTTVMRTLETVVSTHGMIKPQSGWTNKFIFAPYDFTVADAMVSNLHLPGSTQLMMVAAFGGYDNVMNAYDIAVKEGYRFGTYGDAMLIL